MNLNDAQQLLANVSQKMPIWEEYRANISSSKIYYDAQHQPSALLVFSTNQFHPHALGIAVYALSSDMFSIILNDAIQEVGRQHKDRLIIWECRPFSPFTEWLLTQGFSVWRETVSPNAQLADIALPSTIEGQVLTAADIQADHPLKTQLIEMSLAYYRQVHTINPMAVTAPAQWEQIVFPDVLSDAPMVLIKHNQITAYTFPFEDNPGTLTFGWLGATNPTALWMLQAAQIQWAKNRGMVGLSGEFDGTDPLALATYRHWPFVPAPVYTMVGKKIKN